MNKNYIVTCLTYKRKDPKIFKMLKDDDQLVIHFGIRKEELAGGYYDEWMNLEFANRIQFIPLYNVIDAGDTRQKILDWVHAHGYQYCIMLDDTVEVLRDDRLNCTKASVVIENAIKAIESSDLNPIGLEFLRPGCTTIKKRKVYLQAWIIDVKRLFDAGITFRCVKDVGWDDFVFSWEVHNHGFYTLGLPWFTRIAKSSYPWANQPGGTHVGEDFDVQRMIEKNNAKCRQAKAYLEQTFGAKNVSIRKLTSSNRTFDYVHAEWKEV